MVKQAVQQGRSERRDDAYRRYVEPLREASTQMADCLTILLELSPETPLHFVAVERRDRCRRN